MHLNGAVNLEFPGTGINQTVHAEQCLVTLAAQNGEVRLEQLALSAAPCGHCRQFLNETSEGSHIKISFEGLSHLLQDLLPYSFGPAELGNASPLFAQKHPPKAVPVQACGLVEAAMHAATCSYSPYTASPSGVAFRLIDGSIYSGFYIENCAFNPSIAPLQAALINMVGAGRGGSTSEIEEIVLVERKDAPIQQEHATRTVAASFGADTAIKIIDASSN